MRQPFGFDWVVPGEIAAMGRPHDLRKDLEFLKEQQIHTIVSLTEMPLQPALIEEFDYEYKHIPVADFQAPDVEQITEFVTTVRRSIRKRRAVVVHCGAGRGRTGTMIACYLVSRGRTAGEALDEVRKLRPGSVETSAQEKAVAAYARRCLSARKNRKKRRP